MADANKPVRLNLIAREFNLGVQTIADFLASKGIEVDAKPNTKIDASAYALVRANFQDQKEAKEKAVSSSSRAIVERESVTLASARKRTAPVEEVEVEIDLSVFQKSQQQPSVERVKPVEPTPEPEVVAPAPEPKAEEPAQEEVPAEAPEAPEKAPEEVKAVEEAVVEEPKEEAAQEAKEKKGAEVASGQSCEDFGQA